MSSGVQRMPESLRMSRADNNQAKQNSRWLVEQNKIEVYCSGMSPTYRRKPGSTKDWADVVRFTVNVDQDMHPGSKPVKFYIMMPDNYPNKLPMIYPDGWTLKWNSNNHTFRDRKGTVHICTMFENQWSREGSIAGLMMLTSIWYHKYLHWETTKEWPGRGQYHCSKCGRPNVECNCR